MHRQLWGARGYLASAVALSGTAGLGTGHGWDVTQRWVRDLWNDEEFMHMVEARRAKFATM